MNPLNFESTWKSQTGKTRMGDIDRCCMWMVASNWKIPKWILTYIEFHLLLVRHQKGRRALHGCDFCSLLVYRFVCSFQYDPLLWFSSAICTGMQKAFYESKRISLFLSTSRRILSALTWLQEPCTHKMQCVILTCTTGLESVFLRQRNVKQSCRDQPKSHCLAQVVKNVSVLKAVLPKVPLTNPWKVSDQFGVKKTLTPEWSFLPCMCLHVFVWRNETSLGARRFRLKFDLPRKWSEVPKFIRKQRTQTFELKFDARYWMTVSKIIGSLWHKRKFYVGQAWSVRGEIHCKSGLLKYF